MSGHRPILKCLAHELKWAGPYSNDFGLKMSPQQSPKKSRDNALYIVFQARLQPTMLHCTFSLAAYSSDNVDIGNANKVCSVYWQ